jgi:nicotinamide mononucleotide adenylyltransferase
VAGEARRVLPGLNDEAALGENETTQALVAAGDRWVLCIFESLEHSTLLRPTLPVGVVYTTCQWNDLLDEGIGAPPLSEIVKVILEIKGVEEERHPRA